ncbi:hypothetical protein SS50377_22371 [Spironucleus salmonicida]|uniref:SHIPPO 1-like protein n=1 Tax=Spironucleus salmonicida TaxID=348837 RepID=V6LN38_9EUKA|nr:hypothetical protein SS50377_22371 [Spironucleus salmonicida]|eukprot:EST42134.1 Hypothetical protein SS50377_ee011 [Spironucleus salmonicida]
MDFTKTSLATSHLKYFQTIGPGPGGYDPIQTSFSPQYTIKNKYSVKAEESLLGPNYYHPVDKLTSQQPPKYSIQQKTGSSLDSPKYKKFEPSPNTYNPKFDQIQKRPPSHSLKSKQTQYIDNNIPGPGAYEEKRQSTAPSYSLKSRPQQKEIEVTPGPGQYSPQRQSSSPQYSFRTKHKELSGEQLLIGPGSYDISRKDYGRAALFAGRTYINQTWETPGPGTYTAEKLKNHSPQFSLAGRYEKRVHAASPGPIYQIHTEIMSPAYSIKGKYNAYNNNTNPGPGAYYKETQRPQSGYKMNDKTKRMIDNANDNPAPNNYNVKVYRKGAKPQTSAYIGQKYNSNKIDITPGPGAYYTDSMPPNKNQGISIGKKYQQIKIEKSPGAGAYNPKPQRSNSPQFTIRPKTNIGRGGF